MTILDNRPVSVGVGAIDLRGITKHYGEVLAVDALDLTVHRGEFLTLLGPSGCGKTTTLRIIGGFEFPESGRVHISGQDMTDNSSFRRPVNTVFQKYALFPHMTVRENIAYGLRAKGVDRRATDATVRRLLEMVRLPGIEDRKPRQLSGGQQQRVALARALALEPNVLLLDEPLGSLDYKLRKEMQVELKEIHHRLGTTFVYVTHDQEEALAMSDRICVMRRGKVVQDGTPAEIYDSPNSRYVADFVGDMNFADGVVVDRGPGTATVRVDGIGELVSEHVAPAVRAGDAVTVGIRHEDVLVDAAIDAAGINVVRAHCVEQLLVGASTRLALEAGPWRFSGHITRGTGGDLRGSEVLCGWPSRRVHVFAKEAS